MGVILPGNKLACSVGPADHGQNCLLDGHDILDYDPRFLDLNLW